VDLSWILVKGWLVDEEDHGEPVDVQELPDGSLLVSDDQSGDIYRIIYGENNRVEH